VLRVLTVNNERVRAISIGDVVPAPSSVEPDDGAGFTIGPGAAILTEPGSDEAAAVGEYLATFLRRGTASPFPVLPADRRTADRGTADRGAAADHGTGVQGTGDIVLRLDREDPTLADEGYALRVADTGVTVRAGTAAGLFRAVQTLRQLLPSAVEGGSVQPGPWALPGGRIEDRPRYPYRGMMLDVARHFVDVPGVKRVIELAALFKINYLHLHLTDDQGWRVPIGAWPRLTAYGGGTEVGGGPGGSYTRDGYGEIVAFAARHHMTIVPEIDLPGHTNAALASYPELNRDGRAPDRYTGTEVGFSSLCAGKDITYRFLDEVFAEVVALTPGPYLHIGGDEAKSTGPDEYATMVERAQDLVAAHGRTAIGWHEMAVAKLAPSTVVQYWGTTPDAPGLVAAAEHGNKVILSPANRLYLDMKYDEATPIGLSWAGHIPVVDSYDWDPGAYLSGLDPASVLGVEAPLWTETVTSMGDIEYLALPRLAAAAELGWSPVTACGWAGFQRRLAAQAPRWRAMGVGFFASPEIPWAA
jgi:hexosaminidase